MDGLEARGEGEGGRTEAGGERPAAGEAEGVDLALEEREDLLLDRLQDALFGATSDLVLQKSSKPREDALEVLDLEVGDLAGRRGDGKDEPIAVGREFEKEREIDAFGEDIGLVGGTIQVDSEGPAEVGELDVQPKTRVEKAEAERTLADREGRALEDSIVEGRAERREFPLSLEGRDGSGFKIGGIQDSFEDRGEVVEGTAVAVVEKGLLDADLQGRGQGRRLQRRVGR